MSLEKSKDRPDRGKSVRLPWQGRLDPASNEKLLDGFKVDGSRTSCVFQKNILAAVWREVRRVGELGGSETTQKDPRDSVREGEGLNRGTGERRDVCTGKFREENLQDVMTDEVRWRWGCRKKNPKGSPNFWSRRLSFPKCRNRI